MMFIIRIYVKHENEKNKKKKFTYEKRKTQWQMRR